MAVVVSASSMDDAAERVGRYIVVRPIRKGGMGALSLAFDSVAGDLVLLKRLRPGSDGALRDRFLDEIRITMALEHPNLVRPRASSEVAGAEFLVCDWIDGPDVERLLEIASRYDVPPPLEVLSGVFTQVLAGLGYLHRAQVLHRDVTPANIMVGYDGTAHLVDYGITKFEGKQSRTVLDGVPGTQGYIAPELEAGKPPTVQSDLYALASSLWYALTGLKFLDHGVDNDGKPMLAHRLAELGRVDVPPPLLTFLWRNLHRTPSVRCETAEEAKELLAKAVAPASTEQVAQFVGQLFAAEKQLAAEQLDECKRKFGAPKTAVLPRVEESTTKTTRTDTIVLDAQPRRRGRLLIIALGAGVVCVGLAIAGWRWSHRPVAAPPEHVAPPPVPPVVVAPSPVENPSPVAVTAPVAVLPSTPAPPVVAKKVAVPSPPKSTAPLEARQRLSEANDLVKRGHTRLAREMFAELTAEPTVRPQAFLGLAKLAYKSGDYSEAVAVAGKASSAGAGPDALMVRASSYLRLGQAEKAEADFSRVLALQPDNINAAEGKKAAAQLRKGSQP
jgi:serine/threonine-protein kinase